ncbi:MAG TPA: YaeQ family protein [Spirochaetota bacterium]
MALKPTIYKALLDISDIDRGYYAEHSLTVACHPSETTERMMMRILAFACNAHERLTFGADIGDTDEPALWRRDLTGAIEQWIEIGQPDGKKILKACGRAGDVIIYSYGRSPELWWNQIASSCERAKNLSVYGITDSSAADCARLAERTMKLHCMIQDGEVSMGNESTVVNVEMMTLRKK